MVDVWGARKATSSCAYVFTCDRCRAQRQQQPSLGSYREATQILTKSQPSFCPCSLIWTIKYYLIHNKPSGGAVLSASALTIGWCMMFAPCFCRTLCCWLGLWWLFNHKPHTPSLCIRTFPLAQYHLTCFLSSPFSRQTLLSLAYHFLSLDPSQLLVLNLAFQQPECTFVPSFFCIWKH